jgi:DNA-binding NarL/FixJ family response regulator
LAVILSQSCLHIGLEQSGLAEAFKLAPAEVMPEVVDTTQGTATIFPALTRALIHLHQADPAGAEAAYALAGPIRSWTPSPAMRMAAWGHAAAALGRLDPAATDLQTAVSICDANGARGYAVQARVEFAAVLTRRQGPGDASEAAAAVSGAAGEAQQLGMLAFTNRIEQLRATLPAGSPIRSPLSRRESEVASLIGRGLTNKQIAEALYVSERTAENHVQHILVKLGFNNRSQIATWSSRQCSGGAGR